MEWIDIKKDKPEKHNDGHWYHTVIAFFVMPNGTKRTDMVQWTNNNLFVWNGMNITDYVTHWMEGPKPPETESLDIVKETTKILSEELNKATEKEKMDNLSFGDIVKAKCSATARAISNTKCVYVSSMTNELCIDDIDMKADWNNVYDLPLPTDEELKIFKIC